jgi:hypothetical protein
MRYSMPESDSPEKILDHLNDPVFLKDFIVSSYGAEVAKANMFTVASEIHLAQAITTTSDKLESVIKSMADSLEGALANHAEALVKSAKASERHANSLKWATWALVVATIGLVFVAVLQLFLALY